MLLNKNMKEAKFDLYLIQRKRRVMYIELDSFIFSTLQQKQNMINVTSNNDHLIILQRFTYILYQCIELLLP